MYFLSSGRCLALKKCKFGSEISLTGRHREAWAREVDIMLRLDHPGVVSCYPTPPGLDPGTKELPTLTMEFCQEGDLRRLLNKPQSCRGLSQSQVAEWTSLIGPDPATYCALIGPDHGVASPALFCH